MAQPILHLSIPVHDLAAARTFYEDVLGCEVGRVRERWLDVWFFGLQLTLHLAPEDVRPPEEQGGRHFGVVLGDADAFASVARRLRENGSVWLVEPRRFDEADLNGKLAGKLADPSGNVIEIKYYADPAQLRP